MSDYITVLLPDNKCRPLLLPSTGCKDVNHEVSAGWTYPLRARRRGQCGGEFRF